MAPKTPPGKTHGRKITLTPCRCNVISFGAAGSYLALMIYRALCLCSLAAPALATTQDDVLQAQLRPGWQMENGAHMAAVELQLAPGWKTYWRSPGDAGIPPSFDWSGSENVKSVRIHWPAPAVFLANGMQTIGYHDQLILPLEVLPIDPAKPIRLDVRMELGVCDEICLPASVQLATDLAPPGAPDASIKAALSQRAATAQEAGVTGVSCQIDPIKDGLRLTARLGLPDPGLPEVVAFETADREVWVAEAVTERQGGELVAMTELVPPSGAPFALDRSQVTMTILAATGAVEVRGCPAP
ncbi:MAG: protein-disulfide reductase DsbD domain-containing protein [Tabrizicola sp.]